MKNGVIDEAKQKIDPKLSSAVNKAYTALDILKAVGKNDKVYGKKIVAVYDKMLKLVQDMNK